MPRGPSIQFRRLGKGRPSHRVKGRRKVTPFGIWHGDLKFAPMNGRIYIDPRQPEREMLDTAVHELLHDACPYLEEDAVERYGTHIGEALWRMGWRLKDKPAAATPASRRRK